MIPTQEQLKEYQSRGLVSSSTHSDGRTLWCYTKGCQFDRAWDAVTTVTRGLVFGPSGELVALPYPKFFNWGEMGDSLPNGPFGSYEKVDGSLGIIHFYGGEWHVATKGSLTSDQAKWATDYVRTNVDTTRLDPFTTYLAEIVYPENRVVVSYEFSGLVLTGAYRLTGEEVLFDDLRHLESAGFRLAKSYEFKGMDELVATVSGFGLDREGVVVRYANGYRVKVKGDEYCRVHRLVSRVTPLAVYELLLSGDDVERARRELPEEFLTDFDRILWLLRSQYETFREQVMSVTASVSHLSDRELGLALQNGTVKGPGTEMIFSVRKGGDKFDAPGTRSRRQMFTRVRPDGNVLPGYKQSTLLNRFAEEE